MGVNQHVSKKRPQKWRPTIVYPSLGEFYMYPLERVNLTICWTRATQPEFKTAQMYTFISNSMKLPRFEEPLMTEFLCNYDPNDNISIVQGREVAIDEQLVSDALSLPMSEQTVDPPAESKDFVPALYFKTRPEAHDKKQKWKIAVALTPELLEWLKFVQRRLFLSTHMAYLRPKLLNPAIQTMIGMVFNWAHFVATHIHYEVDKKLQKGMFSVLLCASYISIIVRYVLNKPDVPEKRKRAARGQSSANLVPSRPEIHQVESDTKEEQPTPTPSTAPQKSPSVAPGAQPKPDPRPPPRRVPRSPPVVTRLNDAEAGPSTRTVVGGLVKAKLQAGLTELMEYMDELQDDDNLKLQLAAVSDARDELKFEVKQQQEVIKLQEIKVKEFVAKLEPLQLASMQADATIEQLQKEVELHMSAELNSKEMQTILQEELQKYKVEFAKLELRNTNLSTKLDITYRRITELEEVQKHVAALEDAQKRILELEAVQTHEMELKAQVMKLEVQLQHAFVNRSAPEQIVGPIPSAEQPTAELKDLHADLDMKNARIDQLEAQLRTVGLRNEELCEKLEGPEQSEDEEAEEADVDEAQPMETDAEYRHSFK